VESSYIRTYVLTYLHTYIHVHTFIYTHMYTHCNNIQFNLILTSVELEEDLLVLRSLSISFSLDNDLHALLT